MDDAKLRAAQIVSRHSDDDDVDASIHLSASIHLFPLTNGLLFLL